jgi:diguanylate cyclase (GGDEF)-like protein/putative nucleotidyltransferase with HDIG domain
MNPSKDPGKYGRAYVSVVVFLGLGAVGTSILQLSSSPIPLEQWFLLAALTLVSGSATIKLPAIPASISISETFVFTAVLLYGPAAGTVIVALDGLVMSFWIARRIQEPSRAFFNMSAPAVSVWCSAHLFFHLAGIVPLNVAASGIDRILPALIVFAVTYFSLNSWLITIAIALHTRSSALTVWRRNFVWLSINYFCGASVAILLVVYTRSIDIQYVGVIVPLLLVMYFTFKTSLGRVEDANRHVEEVNTLYLSTIETLAMAIDAKDQITHGHIRRVQEYATGLARHVGVTDSQLIKAIEAAALLHDMGKLAVPEYILNKPGKLTPAEFEKMKLHASVGADLLSAIDFPYPVVPIVRHHHEQWDGSGYPAGIKGVEIPIGARILAVVDCFDALTSDRPYRSRLTDGDALRILMERRGSVYDPLVVDTFVKVYREIAPALAPSGLSAQVLDEIAGSRQHPGSPANPPRPALTATGAGAMLTMQEFTAAIAEQVNVSGIGDVVVTYLRRLVPVTLCVVYLHEATTEELVAIYASGDLAASVKGLTIPLGDRLSGWVAANHQTIVNSDPALDLGEIARTAPTRLRSCLSTPLLDGAQVVGVLALYSAREEAFGEAHQRIAETIASHSTQAFRSAAEADGFTRHDLITGLPNVQQLEHTFNRRTRTDTNRESMVILVFIDVINLNRVNIVHGRDAGDESLRHVVEHILSELAPDDLLFRYGDDEFVALLSTTDSSEAETMATRMRDKIRNRRVLLPAGSFISVDITATAIRTPDDGKSLQDLVGAARTRGSSHGVRRGSASVH